MVRIPGADRLDSPLDRHVALVGFMGAGKTSLAVEVASRIGRGVSDVDAMVEHAAGDDIATFLRERGEAAFR